jgi:hydrogenase maturation protein HypF
VAERARKRIRVRGIVQGVGFRPFVHNLAVGLHLCGYVLNSSDGLEIEIEGPPADLDLFLSEFRDHAPPLAEIRGLTIEHLGPAGYDRFFIRHSVDDPEKFVLVSPDVATCEECRADFTDRANRRFGYPFTNCTNCGPRYTIIEDIPYDRPKTTMRPFKMCPACASEYADPQDRRFHAQPNGCPECGPSLLLLRSPRCDPHSDGKVDPPLGLHFAKGQGSVAALRETRQRLHEGDIVAIKGLGGFLLACDAENDAAVSALRARKRRSDKPFALMARDVAGVETFCWVSDEERQALANHRAPIVVLTARLGNPISPAVAPRNRTLGVMLPYTPLHYLLFGDDPGAPAEFRALVMTSGNISEEPIVTSNEEAWQGLAGIADWFLFHDRGIYMRVDDSVVRVVEGRARTLRRSRGFAPHPVDLGLELAPILAVGGELKNTFCLTKGRYAIVSQHIGDLENYETLVFFKETLANLKKLFRVDPRAVAYDLHPLYLSSKFAEQLPDLAKFGVQHHHAHIASCMAENGLRDAVIGVAFDGTGYGTDGQIWGGEFLVADFVGFERAVHFRYVPLPGGDAAVREPWRSALSYFRDALGPEPFDVLPAGEVAESKLAAVDSMLRKGVNTVMTSSCGRLFDAVASLTGVCQKATFEGQAAIELEMAAGDGVRDSYPFEIDMTGTWKVDFRPLVRSLMKDRRQGTCVAVMAAKFHNAVAEVIGEVCRRLRDEQGINRICLSGGTFQNVRLLKGTLARLRAAGFEVFTHSHVPPNDGGIALGQAVIANHAFQQIARR